MTTVGEQIQSANDAICENIDSLADDRALLSQNVLAQLRNLVEGVVVRLHTGKSSAEFKYEAVAPALAFVRADARFNFLGRFHKLIQKSASHYTLDGDASERLMLKYYEYLFRTRRVLADCCETDVLANLESFPIDLDPSLKEYHEKIGDRIEAVRRSRLSSDRSDRYYIHKTRPFFTGGRIYYEVTFYPAVNKVSKSDRIIAFTDIDMTDEYSAMLALENDSIVSDTLGAVPDDGSSAWSTRAMGERHGVGKDTVARIWRSRGLRPWRADAYKLSADPDFESRVVDVVGLYLNPPEAAAVFAFDEKTQVQALDRTQPSLPMVPGRAGTMTHDYKRHGTVDLFAALNVATGEVLHDTRRSHTGRDVLGFFKLIDLHVPKDLELHVILDNLSAHKSQTVRDWLSHPKRKRWHLHFTPTSSSWLNLVEAWFSVLTRKALANTSFSSVAELENRIDWWVEHYNDNPEPFTWTRTAQQIIDKVASGRATLDRITKSATHH